MRKAYSGRSGISGDHDNGADRAELRDDAGRFTTSIESATCHSYKKN